MSWYNTTGTCATHVLFSKVRYIRNISKQSFLDLADPKKCSETFARLESILQKNGFRSEKLSSGVSPSIIALAEKQFIERDLIYTDKPRAIFLNEPCNLLVALGGENYVTISSIVSGLAIDEAKNMASGAETLIDREISFAYSDSIGYLSPTPSDCGSGLSLSAALFLPSIRISGSFEHFAAISPLSMTIRPMFADKNCPGDLYILSYTPHYLCDEDSAVSLFKNTVAHIVEKEKHLLMSLYSNEFDELLNKAHRALGVLLYSDTLSEFEMLDLISSIRLCICTSEGTIDSLPELSALNYLVGEGLNCSVIVSSKEKCETQASCDRARAKLVSSYIEHKNKEVILSNGK